MDCGRKTDDTPHKQKDPSCDLNQTRVFSLYGFQFAQIITFSLLLFLTNKSEPQSNFCCFYAGSAELRFPASKEECRGTVEMVYERDSLPVSRKVLTEHSNAICRKLRCGHAQHVAAYFGSQDVVEIITELKCSGDDSKASLETCSITAGKSSDLGFLQCSGLLCVCL